MPKTFTAHFPVLLGRQQRSSVSLLKLKTASVLGLLLSPSLLRVKHSLPALFLPTFRGCQHAQDYRCICFNKSHMNSKELSRSTLDQTSNFYKLHIKVIYQVIVGPLYIEIIAVWLYTQKKDLTKMMTTYTICLDKIIM